MSEGIGLGAMGQFVIEWDDNGIVLTHRFDDCDWLQWVSTASLAELGATASEHAATCDGTRIPPRPLTAAESASAARTHELWGPVILNSLQVPLLFNAPRTDTPDA